METQSEKIEEMEKELASIDKAFQEAVKVEGGFPDRRSKAYKEAHKTLCDLSNKLSEKRYEIANAKIQQRGFETKEDHEGVCLIYKGFAFRVWLDSHNLYGFGISVDTTMELNDPNLIQELDARVVELEKRKETARINKENAQKFATLVADKITSASWEGEEIRSLFESKSSEIGAVSKAYDRKIRVEGRNILLEFDSVERASEFHRKLIDLIGEYDACIKKPLQVVKYEQRD